ncbi:MAG: sodium-translocating pyrophosphatase [Dehalococcoidia bacterium]
MDLIYYALIAGIIGLLFSVYLVTRLMKEPRGSEEVSDISSRIEEGAIAFLFAEYKALAAFVIIVAIVLGVVLEPRGLVAVSYLIGTLCSVAAGYIGMRIGTKANCRTVTAVQKSLNHGLRTAFKSGAVMGMTVVSLALVGLSIIYIIWSGHNEEIVNGIKTSDIASILVGFGFGASSIALFARVGGGIYTKGADVGSDLVGKVEAGIPEDDPRNPGVIADNVGDNVGDIAGMGADLFESYSGAIIATLTIAITAGATAVAVDFDSDLAMLPFIIAAVGILCSIAGTFFVRVGEQLKLDALLKALRRGVYAASILVAGFSYLAIHLLDVDGVVASNVSGLDIWGSIVAGLIAGVLIGLSIEYYTADVYGPTRKVAQAAETGTGTIIIKGFSSGMISTLAPVLLVVAAVLIAYELAGLYGVAITAVGMLSTLGITLATDAYGPVADNAGGIAEQADLPDEVREKTDALDSLGNTTAASGKGFAIGSAALTALGLTAAFGQKLDTEGYIVNINIYEPELIVGVLLGAGMVFLFSALTMEAVNKAAMGVVNEVRRQWREIPGLREGKPGVKPDHTKCVEITTKTGLRAMMLPGILAVTVPIIVGIVPFLGPEALVGLLIGAISSGYLMAVTMANAGGTWDNAKKWIEQGNLGGKGSEPHKAAVVGDTVGDPFKDTSGPSLNILIKLMSMISLLFAPVFASIAD